MQYPTEIKLKLNLLCDFKGNRKIASKVDSVALYKHRTMIIFFGISGWIRLGALILSCYNYNILESRGIREGDELWKCPS